MQNMSSDVNPLQPLIHVIGGCCLVAAIIAITLGYALALVISIRAARAAKGTVAEKIRTGIFDSMALILPVTTFTVVVCCAVTGVINWVPLLSVFAVGMSGVALHLYADSMEKGD